MADEFCLKMPDFHVTFRDLLPAANLRHGTIGFTSLPKEGVLMIFSPRKVRWLRPGLNPRLWVPKASTLSVDHRRRCDMRLQLQQRKVDDLTNSHLFYEAVFYMDTKTVKDIRLYFGNAKVLAETMH